MKLVWKKNRSAVGPVGNFVFVMGLLLFSGLSVCCEDRIEYSADARHLLDFSLDTLSFDTVFTGLESPVGVFSVYNRNDEALRMDVSMSGGQTSFFRMNVDGEAGADVRDVELLGGDSLMCFVSVSVPEGNSDTPVAVADSIAFRLESGAVQFVLLKAFGQDVIRLDGTVLERDTTFVSARPYLVYDSLFVREGATLSITQGTKLHFHNGAYLRVAGRIIAEGTPDSMIVMCGDRSDKMLDGIPYDILSGRWGGVLLDSCSFGNRFVSCDIHGGEWGIRTDTSNVLHEKILIEGCIIHNVKGNALELNFCRSRVCNSQITNAGNHCVALLGGRNAFRFCTIANFYPWSLHESALDIRNISDSVVVPLVEADFADCIITGSGTDELTGVVADSIKGFDEFEVSNYSIHNSLILTLDTLNEHLYDNVWDSDCNSVYGSGNFRHVAKGDFKYDFRLDSLSSARFMVLSSYPFAYDAGGVGRPESHADAGCWQFVPY